MIKNAYYKPSSTSLFSSNSSSSSSTSAKVSDSSSSLSAAVAGVIVPLVSVDPEAGRLVSKPNHRIVNLIKRAFLKALTFTKDFTENTEFNKCRSRLVAALE